MSLCSELAISLVGSTPPAGLSIPAITVTFMPRYCSIPILIPMVPTAPIRFPPCSHLPSTPHPHRTHQNSAPLVSYSPLPLHGTLSSAPLTCSLTPTMTPSPGNSTI